jgi:hypothetical protein
MAMPGLRSSFLGKPRLVKKDKGEKTVIPSLSEVKDVASGRLKLTGERFAALIHLLQNRHHFGCFFRNFQSIRRNYFAIDLLLGRNSCFSRILGRSRGI